MKTHDSNLHDYNEKYSCDICSNHYSQKGNLVRHKKIVHGGVRHPCNQCKYQATTKGNLAVHQRAVHEGVT